MAEPEILAGRYLLLDNHKPRSGGSAVVRKAIITSDGRPVAVKFVSGGADGVLRKLVEREVGLLRKANQAAHPNIITLVDHGVEEETSTPYLVFDWVDKTLSDLLADAQPWDWRDFCDRVLRPVAGAIAFLHSNQITHRDVKPGNILWNDEGVALLADFGIAKQHRTRDDTTATVGSLRSHLYAPPERESELPFVRDVFSLGVLAVQGLCNQDARATEFHELQPVLDSLELPPPLDDLIRRSIALSPNDRPVSGKEFLRQLDLVLADEVGETQRLRVSLKLTKSAIASVTADGSSTAARTIIEHDLRGRTHASSYWDPQQGGYDFNSFLVLGEALRLLVRLDVSTQELVVVSARKTEYEALEREREAALVADTFVDWSLASPLSVLEARQTQNTLLARLREHREAEAERRASGGDAMVRELLAVWQRTLTAREVLGLGVMPTIRFERSEARGHTETAFGLSEPLDLDVRGTEWQYTDEVGRICGRGAAVEQGSNTLSIRWNWHDSGSIAQSGKLTPYLGPAQIAIDRQRDALQRLESGEAVLPSLADILAQPSKARPPREIGEIDWATTLDVDKQTSVRAGLGTEDCVLVTGPPGTGKTRMIAELVAQELARNSSARILLVSQTHVAIDNALERIQKLGVASIVRMAREDDDRVAETSSSLRLDLQLQAWSANVRRNAEGAFAALSSAGGMDPGQLSAAMHLQAWRVAHQARNKAASQLRAAQLADDTTASRLELTPSLDELRRQHDDAVAREDSSLLNARSALGDSIELGQAVTVGDIDAALEMILEQSEDSKRLLDLLKLQAEWIQRVSADRRMATILLEDSSVVAGTCLGFIGHPSARTLNFDLCIIDEASKSTSTEVLVPMVRASRIVLVGDVNQLPPLDEDLLREPSILREADLLPSQVRETLFERLSSHLPSSNQFRLTEQYRMVPAIGDMISTCFYDGWLRSADVQGPAGYDLLSKPVLWLDTSRLNNRRETRDARSAGSYVNNCEADAVTERLTSLQRAIDSGLIPRSDRGAYHVIVIAPYRSQTEELKRRLDRAGAELKDLRVEVESVDAVQGRECDLAIFSVTRSNKSGKLGFLSEPYWRRINVALSRARFGLTIVGDAEFCDAKPGGLKKVLSYIREHPETCELRTA
ncbi:hypothetical protein FIV50_08430 [Microbacterium foliorum]|uniref:Protein kinase domain-containing protein n=1 Tax=Microbacterium foliorum TaxID=104336 RepID=A0A4Y5YQP4_9MICO|nr:AAA domain-containing protein [Microbacterium foliorum]QDE34815.1 hypothetical protein FIV50_08430 [Microbacterium foliorum]